jgi:hypothetical protein
VAADRSAYLFRMAAKHPIERWTMTDLLALVPGTTSGCWKRDYLPKLLARRILVADRDAWLGRRGEIEAALLERQYDMRAGDETEAGLHSALAWLRTLRAHATYPNAAITLAIGVTSALVNWGVSAPLIVLGMGLLAGRIAKDFERPTRPRSSSSSHQVAPSPPATSRGPSR